MTRLGFLKTASYRLCRLSVILVLSSVFFLSACKEVLYSNLSEHEANEMVAVLDSGGIRAVRERDKSGAYSLLVDGRLVPPSVSLLKARGYPRQQFESLGDVFAARGLVGTPFEERARFMHALNEELSQTIAGIDGVRQARVHVMIPHQQGRSNANAQPARASVVITHDGQQDFTRHVTSIKALVSHSVPELSYDDVAVALFAARPAATPAAILLPSPSVQAGIAPKSAQASGPTILIQLSLLALVVGLLLVFARMRRRLARNEK